MPLLICFVCVVFFIKNSKEDTMLLGVKNKTINMTVFGKVDFDNRWSTINPIYCLIDSV